MSYGTRLNTFCEKNSGNMAKSAFMYGMECSQGTEGTEGTSWDDLPSLPK